jgi:23S rRNA (uracil1939-C5)-methyltransferase
MDVLELEVTRVVAGGDGMARDPDGRVVFVRGALPGERVRAQVTSQRKDFAHADALDVLEASTDRVAPPCPHVADGCGGCDWQHVAPERQRHLKAAIVADALRRQAHLDVEVDPGPVLGATRHRSTLRGVAEGGRFGLRATGVARRRAHRRLPGGAPDPRRPDRAPVARRRGRPARRHPDGGAPRGGGGGPDDEVTGPGGTLVVTDGALAAGRRAWFHEVLGGHRFRVSARSFLQARPDGADALVDLVRAAAGPAAAPGGRMVDLYGGIGLFAATVGREMRTTVVESSASAVADARINLADLDARVVKVDAARWRPTHADLVVADPPRAGLGKDSVGVVGATGAARLVLVSCDPAALGRDARLLVAAGWRLAGVTAVDLFPHTSHVEAVSTSGLRAGGAS